MNEPDDLPEAAVIDAAFRSTRVSNADVARRLDVDPSLVSQWRKGRRPVARHHAGELAGLLGVRPERISRDYREALELAQAGRRGMTQDEVERYAVRGTGSGTPIWMQEAAVMETQNGYGENSPEARLAQLEQEVHSLSLALASLASVMVQHRPVEAADAAASIRRQVPPKYRARGSLRELLEVLERAHGGSAR